MTIKQAIGALVYRYAPVSRRAVDIIRYEIAAALLRARNAVSISHRRKVMRLRGQTGLSINLASGGKGAKGWINVEMSSRHADNSIALDIRKPLPFATGSAGRILMEHVLEHLDFHANVPSVLLECHRILEPGGVLRIIVPDLERYCRAYADGSPEAFAELGWDLRRMPADMHTRMEILNHQFHQGGEHLFGWDFETLDLCLRKAGFREVKKQSFRVSMDPLVAIDLENHRPYSLYVDALK